jgi:glycosyltransferase involved in cell wall biosynthesis
VIKILHLIQTSGPGGAEKLLLSLTHTSRDKHIPVVGLLKNGWLCGQLQGHGVKVEIISSGSSFDHKLIQNLVNLIKKEKIDIVHSHLLDMNFYSSIAALLTCVPHLSTEHGDIHHTSKKIDIKIFLKAKAISWFSDKIVFVSKFTKNKFLKIAKVPEEKTAVIYNGINLEEYKEHVDIRRKKAEIDIKEGEFVIGNVANLYPVKGQIYLLKAAKIIINEFPNTKFLVIGRGQLEDELKKEAYNLGIGSNVKFLGFREDIKELLKIMDVFVLSSITESFSIATLEAMASGTPVVCTRSGGPEEIITHEKSGLLVPSKDIESLASAICRLIKDKDLANRISKEGLKTAERFAIYSMLDQYESLYLKCFNYRANKNQTVNSIKI